MKIADADSSCRVEFLRPSRRSVSAVLCSGFSLLELLVTMALFGITAQFAWPELRTLLASFQRRNALATFEFDLRRTRAEAMARGTRAILTLAEDGKSYTVGEDHLPYDTADAVPDSILYTTSMPSSVKLELSLGRTIIFNSHGFLSDETGIPRTSSEAVTLYSFDQSFGVATVFPVGVARFSKGEEHDENS